MKKKKYNKNLLYGNTKSFIFSGDMYNAFLPFLCVLELKKIKVPNPLILPAPLLCQCLQSDNFKILALNI